jgi:hypothetical protein
MLVPVIFLVSVFTRYQIQPVSVFFGRYCCTVNFGGNTFLSFRWNSFLKNSEEIPFFLQKKGEVYKVGAEAPPS